MRSTIQRACLFLALAASPCVALAQSSAPRFIVQFSTPEPPAALAQWGVHVVRKLGIGAHVVESDVALTQQQAEDLKRALENRPGVAYVVVDAPAEKLSAYAPNDRYYPRQDDLFGPNGIGAPRAWGITYGAGVRIAVIDDGPTVHPELAGKLVGGYDMRGRDADPFDRPCMPGEDSHSTMVAGIAVAIANNARGIAGVAHGARVVPVRVLGSCFGGDLSDVIDGITWAVGLPVPGAPANGNPVEVINLSLGMGGLGSCPKPLQIAIDAAVARGVAVVAAAGNKDRDVAKDTPANCANVITVGATLADGRREPDSNWGPGIDLAAPGYVYWPSANDAQVTTETGTSMAAPHVAGIVALAQAAAATPLTPAKMEAVLKAHATPFRVPMDHPLGTGIANAPATVIAAQAMATGADRLDGVFTLVTQAPDGSSPAACMIVGDSGRATRPELYKWPLGGETRRCGFRDDAAVLGNAQGAWDIYPVTTSQGLVAHVVRSRVNGQCLIRSQNGNEGHFSLHLWSENPDRTYCGFPSADVLVSNGQAAWYFDDPTRVSINGTNTLRMGLQTIRPKFGFLGFSGASLPSPNVVTDEPAWTFTAWPLAGPREGGEYAISNVQTGQCMRITGDDYRAGTAASTSCMIKRERFRWANGQLSVAVRPDRCLRVVGSAATHAAIVGLGSCVAPARWRLEADGRIRSLTGNNDFCLDAQGDGTSAITTVKCSANRASQQFRFEP